MTICSPEAPDHVVDSARDKSNSDLTRETKIALIMNPIFAGYQMRRCHVHLASNKIAGKDELLRDWQHKGRQLHDVGSQRLASHLHQLLANLHANDAVVILSLDDSAAHTDTLIRDSSPCNDTQLKITPFVGL